MDKGRSISINAFLSLIDDLTSTWKGGESFSVDATIETMKAHGIVLDAPCANIEDLLWLLIYYGSNEIPRGRGKNKELVHDGILNSIVLLLEHGADATFCDDYGQNLLFPSINAPQPEYCRALLQHGADVNRADIRGLTFLGYLLDVLKNRNVLYPWLFFDKVIRLFSVVMKYGVNPCLPYYGVRKYEVPGVCRSETSFIELIPLYEIMTLNNQYGAPFRNVVDRYVTEERIDFLKSQESIAPEELFSDKFHVASPKDLKEVTFPSQSDAVLDQKKCVLAVYGIRPLVDARKFDAALKLLAKTLDMDATASFLPHNNQYFVSLLFGELNRIPYDAEERRKNYLDFIELLIADADVNRVDALGATMLIEAVACREPEICRMLIQRGANVNYDTRSYNISCERRYPLFDATLTFCLDREFDAKWRECVSILIQSGAVVETNNEDEDATTHDGEPLYNITEGKPYQPVKFSKKTINNLVALYESLGVPKESLFSKKV